MWSRAKTWLAENVEDSYMIPNHIMLQGAIDNNAEELRRTFQKQKFKTVVVSVGSGTICTGLVKGLLSFSDGVDIVGVAATDTVSLEKRQLRIASRSGLVQKARRGFFDRVSLKVVSGGFGYLDACTMDCPFPCNPWYDRKVWHWLVENINELKQPVLFWNIGA